MDSKLILYAEDDPDDAFFFEMAAKRVTLQARVAIVEDGQVAIDWMSGTDKFANRDEYPMPTVLVLDLKMPRKTGLQVLDWVRSEAKLKDLPVIILSSSGEANDVKAAMDRGATRYFVKTASAREVIDYLATTFG